MTLAVQKSRQIIQAHSKSFSLASKLLPEDCRDDARVVYAYCRHVDDAIDLCAAEHAKLTVDLLDDELQRIYAGEALSDDVLAAFQEVVQHCEIPMEYPLSLLRGMRMDVEGARYESMDDLYRYCFRVAGTVGLMMCHVMGVRHPSALAHAGELGIAMQLTNICRDVNEDWHRGRLYLPKEVLSLPRDAEPGTTPLTREVAMTMRPSVQTLLHVARDYYASGDAGLRYLSSRCAFSVSAARLVYSAIGDQIQRTGCDVLAGRAYVSSGHKLLLCARAAAQTLWSHTLSQQPFERARLGDSVRHVARVFPL